MSQLPVIGTAYNRDHDHSLSSDSSCDSQGSVPSSQCCSGYNSNDTVRYDADSSCQSTSPYIVGFTIVAMRHVPPQPFGIGYDTKPPHMQNDWESLSQSNLCLRRPRIGGNIVCNDTRPLTITTVLRTGNDRGAHLVVVNDKLVAKIYDPSYYEGINEFGCKENVIWDADGDYSREALAYEELQKSTAAKVVTPTFHGAWIIDLVTAVCVVGRPRTYVRQVPLLLREYLHGQVVSKIKARSLSSKIRSTVLNKVLDVEVVLYHAGISHDDYVPRNIIIININGEDTSKAIKVKAIDFNVSSVVHHHRCESRKYCQKTDELIRKWHPKLISPIVRYFEQMNEFSVRGWCSSKDGAPERWLWKQFHNDERYIPIIWHPSNLDIDPRYADDPDESDKLVHSGTEFELEVTQDA